MWHGVMAEVLTEALSYRGAGSQGISDLGSTKITVGSVIYLSYIKY